MPKKYPLIITSIGVLLAIIFVFAGVYYFRNHVQTETNSVQNGWSVHPSISFAQSITFSKSTPNVGYVCGNEHNANNQPETPGNIRIARTQNGGDLWSVTNSLPLSASTCSIYVNPLDENEIIITTESCLPSLCIAPIHRVFRSMNAGMNWNELNAPQGNEGTPFTVLASPTWIDTHLYFPVKPTSPQPPSTPTPPHLIAMSVNGGPMQWIQQNGMLYNEWKSVSISQEFALGKYLYHVIQDPTCSIFVCPFTKTPDQGASWIHIDISQNMPHSIVPGVIDETLYAINPYNQYIYSITGGHQWIVLPSSPETPTQNIGETPDAVTYALLNSGVFTLDSKHVAWTKLTLSPVNMGSNPKMVLSWDSAGHIQKLWIISQNHNTTQIQSKNIV